MGKVRSRDILETVLVALTGVIFIFQCSSWTSPLYPYAYGYDASWYSLMGRAITMGKVPYRDYFDLKGPTLFFYEAFGQLFIKGRNGIFLIQCISIIITVVLVWRTARLFLGRVLSAVVVIAYYFIAYALIWGGNTVEELFMPCSMAAVYLTLDYILSLDEGSGKSGAGENEGTGAGENKGTGSGKNVGAVIGKNEGSGGAKNKGSGAGENEGTVAAENEGTGDGGTGEVSSVIPKKKSVLPPEKSALIMGVGFGVFLFSKITVAAVICACLLTVLVIMIREKEWELIGKCALYFIGGILIILIPIFIYFIVNGAFGDFIYCSFLFAFKRSTDYYESFSIEWEYNLIICYVAFFYGLCMRHEGKRDDYRRLLLIIASVIQFLLLHLGTPYLYYFLCQMPVFTMLFIYFLHDICIEIRELRKRLKYPDLRFFVLIILVAVVFYGYYRLTGDKFHENLMIYEEETGKDQVLDCREISSLVPEWERADIYNLESGMIYYEVNQELPSNKYPVNLPYFLHLDPRIKTAVMNKLEYDTPKWIISERIWDFDDEDVKEFVGKHYELVAENDGEELYRVLDGE